MSFPILIARFVNDLERGGATVIREDDTARMPARHGVALCRLHHAAYDNGLLGIRPDLQLILSDQVIARLQELHWDHGLSEFRNLLLPTLRVPQTIEVRPDPGYLRRGMQERNWSADQIG